jgi:hypothetical protein
MRETVGDRPAKKRSYTRPMVQLVFLILFFVIIFMIKKDLEKNGAEKIENTFRVIEGQPPVQEAPPTTP